MKKNTLYERIEETHGDNGAPRVTLRCPETGCGVREEFPVVPPHGPGAAKTVVLTKMAVHLRNDHGITLEE